MRPGGWTLPVLPMLLSLTALSEDTLLFRSNARFVAVDVQVLSSNRPVTGLTRDDFRVLDNSQPQTISTFGRDDQELDIILLLDVSGSTAGIQKLIRQTAAEATSQLYFRDRVGVIFFDSEPYVIAPPSWDWQKVYQQVVSRPQGSGGTDINGAIVGAARYLKEQARPGARRAIVILTDNSAWRTISDDTVRNELWDADIVLNALLFRIPFPYGNADVRRFARATGSEVLYFKGDKLPLMEVFQKLRQRYSLLYAPPGGRRVEMRNIKIELSKPAKASLKKLTIRARSGYVVGY